METIYHIVNDKKIIEYQSENLIIKTIQDAIDLLGILYFEGIEYAVLHEKNICKEFFKLSNGLAGEILQKFSNYRVKLFIVGDFSNYNSTSLSDFIRESNKGNQVNFVESMQEVKQIQQ